MAKLVVRAGPQMGMEFPVEQSVVQIGRGSVCDVMLQSTQASRQHAEISRQGDQYYIRDMGSTNGTFVNGEQVYSPRALRPGDQVQIGEIVLGFDMGTAAGAMAAAGAATDWEAELWDDEDVQSGAQGGRSKVVIWAMVGVIAVLVVAIGAYALFASGGKETPTPVADVASPTAAIVVVATSTPEEVQVPPTLTPLVDVDLPEVDVDIEATLPPVAPPVDVAKVIPTALPVAPENLEQLPAMISQFVGSVPPEELPQALSAQIQLLGPEQAQLMIGSLFPGVDPAQLPQVVAASFPGLPQSDIEALLGQVFPGQTFDLPTGGGTVGGRIALGIYDEGRDWYDLYLGAGMGGQLTLVTEIAQEPAFSPDGQWLVYASPAPERLGLRLIKTDGSDDMELTTIHEHHYPSFSPDGGRILFYNSKSASLHVINRDGSGEHEIAKGEYPAWSPNGDKIVYRGCVGGGKCGLIVSNADGSNPTQITTHANDAAPRWSPNGGQIVFHSDRDGNWEVYVINSDGSWLRRITQDPATDVMPCWSPDGLSVAFRSDRGGQSAVYTTSGIGGPAFKQFDATFHPEYPEVGQMDWAK